MKQGVSGQGTIVLSCETTPFLLAYRWSNDGFGTQMLVSPAAPNIVTNAGFTPDGEYVVGSHTSSSPYISAWPITHVGGFGTKLADPNTAVAASGGGVNLSADGAYLAATSGASPHIQAYEWSDGFGLKFAAPVTAGGASGSQTAWHPDGNAIAMSIGVSPFINAWKFSALGFGTKYANPGAALFMPTDMKFSPTGGVLVGVWGSGGTPYVYAYPFTYAGGFSARLSNPGTLPAGNSTKVSFNNAGTAVAISHVTAPYVSIYAWTDAGGFGAKYADAGTAITGATAAYEVKWLPGDKVVIITMQGSPYVEAYEWDNTTGFGAKFANPSVLPPGICTGVDFYPA